MNRSMAPLQAFLVAWWLCLALSRLALGYQVETCDEHVSHVSSRLLSGACLQAKVAAPTTRPAGKDCCD